MLFRSPTFIAMYNNNQITPTKETETMYSIHLENCKANDTVSLTIQSSGYEEYQNEWIINNNIDTTVNYPVGKKYHVIINTVPDNAICSVEGTITKEFDMYDSEDKTLVITAEGFYDLNTTVTSSDLVGESPITLTYTLNKKPVYTYPINITNVKKLELSDGQILTYDGTNQTVTIKSYSDTLTYKASADGYKTITGSLIKNQSVTISLLKYYTFSIIPSPSDAIVRINNELIKSVNAVEGDVLNWSVSCQGYITRTGTYTMTASDSINNIELELEKVVQGELSSRIITYGDNVTLKVTNFTSTPTVIVTNIDGGSVNVEHVTTTNTEDEYNFVYSIKCYNVKLRFTIQSGSKTAIVDTDTVKDVIFNASFDKTTVDINDVITLTVNGSRTDESNANISYDSNYFTSNVVSSDLTHYVCKYTAIKAGTSIISYRANNGNISQEITINSSAPAEYVLSTEHNNAVFTIFNNYASAISTNYDVDVSNGLTAEDCAKIKSLFLNNNQSIFYNNTNIITFDEFKYFTGIVNYKDVPMIEVNMFYACTNLTAISIPETITFIDAMVFEQCSKLATITFLGNVPKTDAQTFGRYDKMGTAVTGNKIIKVPSQYIDNYNNALMPDGVTTNYIKTVAVDELGYVIQAITE